MEIRDLKIGDEVQVESGVQRMRDTDDDKYVLETVFEMAKVIEVDKKYEFAEVVFGNGSRGEINADTEWYPIPSNTKIETHKEKEDVVNNPSHYTYDDIDVIDYIEQVIKDYPPHLAFAIGNAIMCIDRAAHKNDREDLAEARWYLERAYKKWEVFY